MRISLVFHVIYVVAITINRISASNKFEDVDILSKGYQVPYPFFAAHFIDGSGNNRDAVNDSTTNYIQFLLNADHFAQPRNIIAAAAYDLIPFPANVSNQQQVLQARDYLLNALQPYRGIFDLQTSVNTFLNEREYSAFDPFKESPPWAIIWSYSDTINGYNNFLNAASKLHDNGFQVLVIENGLTRDKMTQYMKVLPQLNIGSHQQNNIADWIMARVNMGNQVQIANQTGSSGIITSPNYPDSFPYATFNDYYISSNSELNEIILTIMKFEIGSDATVLVYKGLIMDDDDLMYHWRGGTLSPGTSLKISSSSATIRFFSTCVEVARGFKISWIAA